jgi:hypothetical protein
MSTDAKFIERELHTLADAADRHLQFLSFAVQRKTPR